MVNDTCAGTLRASPQLSWGHRMETGSPEAAEKWTEELQSVSLPCLMCLQVPLKIGEAREMERRRKRDSTHVREERVLVNVGALKKHVRLGGRTYMCACIHPQTQCVMLRAHFDFSVQWFLRCVFSSQRSVLYVGMGAGQSTVPSLALSKELLHWEGQFFTRKKIMALVNPT